MTILPGDSAPSFHARSCKNPRYAFDTAAGRNIVLTFINSGAEQSAILQKLSSAPHFDDTRAALFIVTQNSADETEGVLPLRIPGIRAFYDDNKNIEALYGLSRFNTRPISFIISPRLQVIGIIADPSDKHADQIISVLDNIPAAANLPAILSHAPVLIIPNIFEPELCRALINGYKENGGRVSGFMRDVDGKTVEIQDKNHKVRRDWNLDSEDSNEQEKRMIDLLRSRFVTRVIPEIKKSFQFHVTRMERYIVSCYDADEGGHFRAHRDNTTKGTAHRRFAVSLNLNTEEYEGGGLRFPEFGTNIYRPPTGGCCVFSCSLLHEAMPVTRGIRYAFLPFLYDEAAGKIREENMKYLQQAAAE